MALSVLNNIASLAAQNQLTITNGNLQKALFQLSSGSRINTGAGVDTFDVRRLQGAATIFAGANDVSDEGRAYFRRLLPARPDIFTPFV